MTSPVSYQNYLLPFCDICHQEMSEDSADGNKHMWCSAAPSSPVSSVSSEIVRKASQSYLCCGCEIEE